MDGDNLLRTGGGTETTKLQEAAYNAQFAAGLPSSALGRELLGPGESRIPLGRCATYLYAVQHLDGFSGAFPAHSSPLVVTGGRGRSSADRETRRVKIGTDDRSSVHRCEQACLHELAHIVTPDRGPDRELREPDVGLAGTKGHHHAWRVNFVVLVRLTLGRDAARRLQHEFGQWGLPTTLGI